MGTAKTLRKALEEREQILKRKKYLTEVKPHRENSDDKLVRR